MNLYNTPTMQQLMNILRHHRDRRDRWLPWILLSTLISFQSAHAAEPSQQDSIWGEIRQGFTIQARRDPRLTQHLLWYKRNPEYLTRVFTRARPLLYHIVQKAKRWKVPLELTLLPAVESAFQAYAYSPGQAAGLWQFIPATGKTYGLKQNWWIDQRRSPLASTDAAFYFLKDMAREFKGDWLLALAAYNAGAGNVRKAIRRFHEKQKQNPKKGSSIQPTFWDLDLPTETRGYVPRLLALARFVEEAERHQFKLPLIPNKPLTQQVKTGRQIDLSLAAELANIPLEDLYQLNAGLNRWATPPQGPHTLLLPVSSVQRFQNNLKKQRANQWTQWKRHTVVSGESLSEIAQKYHTTVTTIQQENQLQGHQIRAGDTLTIPVPMKEMEHYSLNAAARLKKIQERARPGKRVEHIVQEGESLWDLAQHYRVSSQQIASWNGMAPGDLLPTGRKLVIWAPSKPKRSRPPFIDQMATQTLRYTIRPNDTLSEIAEKFRLSTTELMRQNSLQAGTPIKTGEQLTIQLNVTENTPKH